MVNATTFPYSSVVYITDAIGSQGWQGSGVLITPDEVLTATHVVYTSGIGAATNIQVVAGYDGGVASLVGAGVSVHYMPIDDSNRTISFADSQDDFAIIHLAHPLNVGTMSLGANFTGGSVHVTGYPASAGGQMVDSQQTATLDPVYSLLDGQSIGAGSSGGPIWVNQGNVPQVVGIVSTQNLTTGAGYFTQITTAAANQIETWITQDDGGTPVSTFVLQENASGRGANGIALDYSGIAPAGGNSVIGFQSASFTSGYDAVLLDGPRSSYAIQINAQGATTIKDVGAGDATYGQTVTVSGESYIIFDAAHIGTTDAASAAALTTPPGSSSPVLNYPNDIYFVLTSANAQIAQFYSAMLPWEPQPALSGFEYWASRLARGMSLTAIAQSFINTSYFQQTFGDPGTTHSQHLAYVELLYKNILGMTLGAGNDGVAYWTTQMDDGALNGATTLISFTNAAATASPVNAVSGQASGSGDGWLIAPAVAGGYADAGMQMPAQTVLSQAAANNFYNLSLIDPATLGGAGVTSAGLTLTPGAISLSANAPAGTVILSTAFTQITANNAGETIHDGPGADTITVNARGGVITLGSATTDTLNLANATNTYVFNYAPGKGSLLAVSGTANGTTATLLDGTSTQVHGASLNFGTTTSASPIFVTIGTIGGGSAAEVAAAANLAYAVGDVTGNAAAGSLGEHVTFLGTDSGGNTEIWAFRAPLGGADINGNHLVDAGEITLVATLIGLPASKLTAAELA